MEKVNAIKTETKCNDNDFKSSTTAVEATTTITTLSEAKTITDDATDLVDLLIDEQANNLIDLSIDENALVTTTKSIASSSKAAVSKKAETNANGLHSKEMIYATPMPKSDRQKTTKSIESKSSAKSRNGVVPVEDRQILSFLNDTTKLQKKLQRGAGSSGNNSSGDSEYGKSNFSSLAQEQHFVNLVQQNVIGYTENCAKMVDTESTDDETTTKKEIENGKTKHNEIDGFSTALVPSEVNIKREWVIKLIALCLEQRFNRPSNKLPGMLGGTASNGSHDEVAVGDLPRKTSSSRPPQKQASQYTGVMLLGSNGSGKTSICQSIINGNTGTHGMLNRRLLCCYFINTQNVECHALSTFIRCIVMQILSHSTYLTPKDDVDSSFNQSKTSNDTTATVDGNDGIELDTTVADTTVLETKEKRSTNDEMKCETENAEEENDGEKSVLFRQKSETTPTKSECNEHDEKRGSNYGTYPPTQKTFTEQMPSTPVEDTAKCTTPSKSKTTRNGSKIPVKIGCRTVSPAHATPTHSTSSKETSPKKDANNSSVTMTNPTKNDEEQSKNNGKSLNQQCDGPTTTPSASKQETNDNEKIEYENIEIHRRQTEAQITNSTTPVAAQRKLIEELSSSSTAAPTPGTTQPQPPPKSKSCLQTVADEYYLMLQQNPEILESLNADNIEKNPDECFKKAILFPFLELQPPKSALLFIVDSIDEHYINAGENVLSTLKSNATNRSRTIAELLANHFHMIPKWLFLVCSAKRQNRHIVKKFNGFKKIALDDLRKSHVVKDVQEYIIARLNADFKGLIQFSNDVIECLNQLYIKSNGSILYLEKVLSGILESVFSLREIKLIPCTLNGLYLYICQKSFNKKQYSKIRPILNVLLACSDFVDKIFVFNCLRTFNYTIDESEFDKRIAMMKHILTFDGEHQEKMKIFHNSFSDWLSDVKFSTKKFLCNVNEGHATISMYYTLISDTLCPNQVLRYFGHLIKCDEYATSKKMSLDLILILLESRANLTDCFYTNNLNCCAGCEMDYKMIFCQMPKLRQAIDRFLNKSLNDDVLDFLSDFFKPSLPTNSKILKLLIETGVNNADCQLSYDSLINSPTLEENNEELAELLVKSEQTCQKNSAKVQREEEEYTNNEYHEIVSPTASVSPMGSKHLHTDGTSAEASTSDLLQNHQLLARGKALIHLLANEGNVSLLQRALSACKKDRNGVATIDLEIEDECGQTALNIAARNGHYEIVELLLNLWYTKDGKQTHRVNVNHADRDGWTPLRSASWGGHTEVVKLLIKHVDIQIDLSDKEQRTALRAAAWSGHEDILKALIAAGADVNSTDRQGRTSLIAASYMGHYEIVEILLENGADVNHLDIDGRSALCVAALCGSSGYSRVMSILLEYHANTDQQDNDGMSPLLVSAFEGNTEVCELLLENGADPDLADNMGRTPLWAACTTGHAEIVKLLLFWGCGIDCMDSEGRTVLSIAAAQGNPETVRQLLDRGLDETHRDNAGWTALHYAAFEGYEDICLQLIEAGAKIYECDNEGKNALHIAAQEGRKDVIEALVRVTKVAIDQKAHDGKTAFRLACMEANIDCMEALMNFGCDVNMKDADGRPTLYMLALDNNVAVTKYLFSCTTKVDVNQSDNEGRTPLHVASWQGHLDMVKLLIEHGADVNAMDLDYRTPLHSCAWQGNDKVMEVLLFYGASPDHACKQGATALGISAQEGHENCVSILLRFGANPNKSDHCGRTPIKLAMKSNNVGILRLLETAVKSEWEINDFRNVEI